MKVNDSIRKIFIIELLLFIGWCVVVLAFADYDRAAFYFWGGFGFGVFAFIVAAISFLYTNIISNRNTTEINYIPVYITSVYLIAAIIVNTYFAFREKGKLNVILVSVNLLLFIVFIGLRLYTDDYQIRVDKQTVHSATKIKPITTISAKLGILVSMATDADVKKQLLKLKETVDYSSNVSQGFSEESENLFLLQLNQIETMISEKQDKELISKKIQESMVVWKSRNNVVSTIK